MWYWARQTSYSFERITRAIRFVSDGARFIATNPDVMGPGEGGIVPATGAVAALISAATGIKPYFIGKPNPLMMRSALRTLNAHSEDSAMIGDRMDTDIIAGSRVACGLSWYSPELQVASRWSVSLIGLPGYGTPLPTLKCEVHLRSHIFWHVIFP